MRKFILISLFLFSLGLYITTSVPTTYWGDSAEFAATSALLDISHPPSYPLYNILGKLFTYLPLENIAFKTNLFSAYFSCLTIILIFLIVLCLPLNWDKASKFIVGIFSSLIFASSLTFFTYSIKAEKYALYVFLFALIIFILLLYNKKNDIRYFFLAGFLFLISLTNHLLIIFSLTSFLFLVLTHNYKVLINKKNLVILSLFSAMAFSLYIYLPLRSAKEPKINWARPQTFEGFKYAILLKEQGKLHQDFSKEIDVEDKETRDKIMREKFLKKEMPRDMKRRRVTGRTVYIFLIVMLPFYLSFAMLFKKDYGRYLKNRKFIVLSILLIWIAFHLFSHTRDFLTMSVSIKISDLLDLFKREFSYKDMIKPTLDWIFILFIFFFSFTPNGRKKAIVLSLIFTFILTFFVYFILLGYIEYTKQQSVDFSASAYFDILLRQFTKFGFVMGIIGILKLLSSNLRIFIFFWFLFLYYTILPIMIIFPDNLPVLQERFSLPGYLVFSIFAGFGVKTIIDLLNFFLKNKISTKKLILNNLVVMILLFSSLFPLFLHFREIDKSKYYLVEKYANDIFLTIPKNSIILTKGIDTVFPLWYFSFVEKKRSDITIVYIDALTQKWYIDNLRKNTDLVINNLEKKIKTESDRRTLYIENIIQNNISKYPIYYGGAPLFIPEGIKRGTVIPEGILFKIVKVPRDGLTQDEIKRNEQLLNSYKFTKSLKNVDYQAKDILSIYAGGHFKSGVNYLSLEEFDEALKELNKAIKIDKTFTPPYSTLSQIYLQKSDVNVAEKILKRGIRNNPKNIELLFQLAHLNFQIGNVDESIKLLNKIIKLQPEFIPAYLAKVEVYMNIGKKEEVKRILEEILKIDPTYQPALNMLKDLR